MGKSPLPENVSNNLGSNESKPNINARILLPSTSRKRLKYLLPQRHEITKTRKEKFVSSHLRDLVVRFQKFSYKSFLAASIIPTEKRLSGRVSTGIFYGMVFVIARERSVMKENQIPFYARILLIISIGVALAVALDNIAIGIGIALIFLAGLVVRRNNLSENSGENNE